MTILRRYIIGEVLRAFLLSLLTMTAIFVLFMVAAEAMRSRLLTPHDIAQLVPYVIPSTLPYTIPVSLLFSVTVVYGRIAGDNEIIALKASGLHVMAVIGPTIVVAGVLSGSLWYLSRTWIPTSVHLAKMVLYHDLEDTFYKFLKRDKEFNNDKWPFLIKVSDVDGRIMKDATFNKRAKTKENTDTYSLTVFAKRAEMHFDMDAKLVKVRLEESEVQNYGKDDDVALLNKKELEFEIPRDGKYTMDLSIQELTNSALEDELARIRQKLATERKRQAVKVGLRFASGRIDDVNWGEVQKAYVDDAFFQKRRNELATEKQLRNSMAFGSLLFVILGSPVGIIFAKRDFLSAFMTCFVPIITLYYPLMLFGINMGKEGTMPPLLSLWLGNAVLAILSPWAYRRVIRH